MLLQLGLLDVLTWGAHNITYITQDCASTSSRALTTQVVRADYQLRQCLSGCINSAAPTRWIFMKPYTVIF